MGNNAVSGVAVDPLCSGYRLSIHVFSRLQVGQLLELIDSLKRVKKERPFMERDALITQKVQSASPFQLGNNTVSSAAVYPSL